MTAPGWGLCLDAYDIGTANGTQAVLWTCHGGSNQRWALDQSQAEPSAGTIPSRSAGPGWHFGFPSRLLLGRRVPRRCAGPPAFTGAVRVPPSRSAAVGAPGPPQRLCRIRQ
ncbi:RICIN domain-containing protein [Streptomyces sp. NBC_00076]|uniref:RICIN domain-containing protein n=1 Tax=Streptomyces sp. NBC_00076 TaxID=2975642 RepID=UPI0032538329